MFHPEKVHSALAAKQSHFASAQKAVSQELTAFRNAITELSELDLGACKAKLASIQRPGAHPTNEFDNHEGLIVPFSSRWSNHAQARAWAREVLEGVPTFAVDGSQIAPTKDLSIPIGLVQIGWFENMHRPGGEYVKDIAVEVLSPIELVGYPDSGDELGGALVNLRRFEMEVECLADYLRSHSGSEPKPLALFDGTLIISFAGLMQPQTQAAYTTPIVDLINTSSQSRMPLVGFVDSSSAHDLVDMLSHLTDTRRSGQITDAVLLQSQMQWGDRSQIFVCARDDNLDRHEYYESVCFCYLKTTAELPPARVEFPRWIFDANGHDRILNLIRAECIVGTGYPYALETADAVAVIDLQDRERFYRLVQRFTADTGLGMHFSRKSISKRGRRI